MSVKALPDADETSNRGMSIPVGATHTVVAALPNKKRKWKKPKDKPKRPLSAYNLFFQHEREKIIASTVAPPEPELSEAQAKKRRRRHRKTHGKISFADLAKTIGGKWKALDSASRSVFEARAKSEKNRYNRELAVWNKARQAKASGLLENQVKTPPITAQKSFGKTFPKSIPIKPKSFPQQLNYQESSKMFPKEEYTPHASQKMTRNSQVHSNKDNKTLDAVRSLSSFLHSGGLVKDPQFNATAHRECLELTRQTIEMAKATLSMTIPDTTSFIKPTNALDPCSNIGVANNDDGYHKINPAVFEPLHIVGERHVHEDVVTPDIIDATFWDRDEKQLTSQRDFLESTRCSLGSFWDLDDIGSHADDMEAAM